METRFFVIYSHKGKDAEIEKQRIGANCLGEAVVVAEEMAKMSDLYLWGVFQDVGILEEKKGG